MPLMFHNGKLLFKSNGVLAMSEDCCCCLDEAVEKVLLRVQYSLSKYVLPANTSASVGQSYVINAVHTMTLTGGGGTHTTTSGTVSWQDERCGDPSDLAKITLVRSSSGDPESKATTSVSFSENYSAKVFRRSTATISVWPAIGFACDKTCPDPNQSCQDSEKTCHDYDDKWLWYTTDFQFSLDGNAWTTVSTGWNATTRTYTAARPHTITIRIP